MFIIDQIWWLKVDSRQEMMGMEDGYSGVRDVTCEKRATVRVMGYLWEPNLAQCPTWCWKTPLYFTIVHPSQNWTKFTYPPTRRGAMTSGGPGGAMYGDEHWTKPWFFQVHLVRWFTLW